MSTMQIRISRGAVSCWPPERRRCCAANRYCGASGPRSGSPSPKRPGRNTACIISARPSTWPPGPSASWCTSAATTGISCSSTASARRGVRRAATCFHWRYETVDIAGFLRPGKNVLAAVVWNFGEHAPEAQITLETGFVLQGDGEAERVVDTGPSWKCVRNEAYSPVVITSGAVRGYWAAGPGDRVNAAANPWGWESPEFDDSAWTARGRDRAGGRPRGARRAHALDAGAAHHSHDGGARREMRSRVRKGSLTERRSCEDHACCSIRAI